MSVAIGSEVVVARAVGVDAVVPDVGCARVDVRVFIVAVFVFCCAIAQVESIDAVAVFVCITIICVTILISAVVPDFCGVGVAVNRYG